MFAAATRGISRAPGRRLGSKLRRICIQIFPAIPPGVAPGRIREESDRFYRRHLPAPKGSTRTAQLRLITFAPAAELLPELLKCTEGRHRNMLRMIMLMTALMFKDVFLWETRVWNRL